ncbi:MAG: cytochrome P450 [Symploca sp. SIO1B1]|nr:cytochrome P450 [Symploca sp. SIO1B1]
MPSSSITNKTQHRSWISKIYSRVNFWGLKTFNAYWILQYLGSIYPGQIAHHRKKYLLDCIFGHHKYFYQSTVIDGKDASTYFAQSGISSMALQNDGLCTFWMGWQPAIYQITNQAQIRDEYLSPSTAPTKELFGDFMGTLPHGCPLRASKRASLETILGNPSYILSLKKYIEKYSIAFINDSLNTEISLETFTRNLVAYIDSFIPGIIDFNAKPLTEYINSQEYSNITTNFVDLAANVISKMNPESVEDFEAIVPFIKEALTDNFDSINLASETNIIKRLFDIWNLPFTRELVENLSPDQAKELGATIIALYDTTSLSLMWTICFIEKNKVIKEKVIMDAKSSIQNEQLSFIDLVVLEAIRLGGSNPTALWRQAIKPFTFDVCGKKVYVRPGTMIWLDRHQANQDPNIYPDPKNFNPDNIKAIIRSRKDNIDSILARNRYEINSFSMINTLGNPRKCPARLYSAYMQSFILKVIYANCEVNLQNINTEIRKFSAMPKPENPGTICLQLLN